MSLAWVLLDREGCLRAGWRLALHVVLLLAVLIKGTIFLSSTLMLAAELEVLPADPLAMLVAQSLLFGTLVIGVTAASAWVLDTRWPRPSLLGTLAGTGHSLRIGRGILEICAGMGIAALAMGITVGGMALGGMEVEIPGLGLYEALTWGLVMVTLVFAAWMEELLFRGYAYQWLGGSLARAGHALFGRPSGVLASLLDTLAFVAPALALSVAFGALHLSNPSATWLSTGNTAMAGVWFTVLVLRTRSLWPAIAAHWFWNALTVLILGLPVSGVGESSGFHIPTLIKLVPSGPEWLSGGAYGPEGSIACLLALVVATAISAVLPRRRPEDGFAAARRLPSLETS